MKVIAMIPVRRGSTRLSDKPLKDINGKSLVQRVWGQANKCSLIDDIYITTDDDEIEEHSRSFGGNVIRTSKEAPSGSARVSEAYFLKYKNEKSHKNIILNIQGDMPFINPLTVELAINFFKDNFSKFDMVTIAIPIYEKEEFIRDSVVKVVIGEQGQGLYFSRAPIPHSRDGDLISTSSHNIKSGNISRDIYGYKHLGLYLFKEKTLQAFTSNIQDTLLEKIEKLEQLKLLNLGYSIGVCIVPRDQMEHSIEVDTQLDLEKAIQFAKSSN